MMTILPTQRVYAVDDPIRGWANATAEDYDYIRLDSLIQKERTITVAYTTGEEPVRFSSYVAGGLGENSALRSNSSLVKLRNFDGYEMSGGAAEGGEEMLPYAHNFVRWEGQYVPFEQGDAPTTPEEMTQPWPIDDGPEDAGSTEVLTPGYYILVFKYEYEGYYLPPAYAAQEARFLPGSGHQRRPQFSGGCGSR